MSEPASVAADGNLKVVWVPAIANPAAPTLAELNAASAIDLSCYLTADGFNPGTEEETVTDDRLCSRQSFARPGRTSDTLEIGYVFRGQDTAAVDNKAFTSLKHLTTGFIVERWGKDYAAAFAAADVVDVKPVQCGVQRKQAPEANSVQRIMQTMHIVGTVRRDVPVPAGA